MRARLALAASLASLLAACARDTSLPPPPPPPGPGSIQGRVVYAVAGQTQRVAAAGAQVSILGTSLSTLTEADGRFYLGGVTLTDGVLLLQASTDGSGTPNRQALLQLADLSAGPGRDIALGDVPVVENASVHGRARLADVSTPGGHGGTLVFVPQGPFMTQTADDGSYTLPELPAGTITLSFFRDRYQSEAIDGMTLSAGQSYTVRDMDLRPVAAGPPSPGTISGTVTAPGGDVTAAAVGVTSATGASVGPVSPDPSGLFALSVPAGVYSLSAQLAGFETAHVGNILVAPAGTAQLAIALTPTPALCTAGVACASGCTTGQVTCPGGPSGAVACSPTGYVMNGTPCGAGLTCQAGNCLPACTPGVACESAANPCHAASVSCTTGVAVCQEASPVQLLPPGTVCGAFQVCSGAGACVACAGGTSCAAANPCHAGAYSCSTGAPVCVDTGASLAPGTSCGSGLVCNGTGTCVACVQGAFCTPANPCHAGAISCSSGAPSCNDAGTSATDGTLCGPNEVCHAGTCGACTVSAACDGATGHAAPPASPDPCKVYATACTTGLPTCAAVSNVPDNTTCGTGLVCRSGACATPGNGLAVLTAPGAMHALSNQTLSVTLQLRDVLGTPMLTPDTVTITAPAGATAPAPAATSAVDGTVVFTIRLGRAVGPQTFVATAPSLYAPHSFVATADAPADGTLVPIANAPHAAAYSIAPGPAASLPNVYVFDVAVASDGTVYYTDSYDQVVKRVDPAGALTVFAGTGTYGFNGLAGPATSIDLAYPWGLALDEPHHTLYVADQSNNRIRAVDTTSGQLSTIAGDGTTGTTPPYGDNGPALSAQLGSPDHVAVGPENPPALYVADTGHGRIRRVDPLSGVITTVLAATTSGCSATAPLQLYDIGGNAGGSIAFDEKGQLFLSGHFCGAPTAGGAVYGIARLNPDATLTLVAGASAGAVVNGVPATSVSFADGVAFAFDWAATSAGARRSNLFVADPGGNWVGRIDGATGRFDLVLGTGTGTSGTSGDFGPATAALRASPRGLAVRQGTRELYVASSNSYDVSMIAGAAATIASSASLAAVTASPQSAYPSQQLAAPLQFILKDGAGNPLSAYPVAFASDLTAPLLPGAWLGATSAFTSVAGIASVSMRPGLALGGYGVVASVQDLHGTALSGGPAHVQVNAVAPPGGMVFSAVNQAHLYATGGVPGPGALVALYPPRGVTAGSDGTIYFDDTSYYVFAMAPSGLVRALAGNGSYWSPIADGGPATGSAIDAFGLALQESGGAPVALFVGDAYNGRVRRIDLTSTTHVITTVAGGGTSNADGPDATATTLSSPQRIRLVGNHLYVADRTANADRLRRVDLSVTPSPIATFLAKQSTQALPLPATNVATCVATGPLVFWGCTYYDGGCSVAPAPDGSLYVTGQLCGAGTALTGVSPPANGIVHVALDGTLSLVAGTDGYQNLTDGATAAITAFDQLPVVTTDGAGNLWVAERGNTAANQTVGYFAVGGNGLVGPASVFHMVGRGRAAGQVGADYVDQSLMSFVNPLDLAMLGTHVVVADGYYGAVYGNAIRIHW